MEEAERGEQEGGSVSSSFLRRDALERAGHRWEQFSMERERLRARGEFQRPRP